MHDIWSFLTQKSIFSYLHSKCTKYFVIEIIFTPRLLFMRLQGPYS